MTLRCVSIANVSHSFQHTHVPHSVFSCARADAAPVSGVGRAVTGGHIRAVAAAERQRERARQRRWQRQVCWIARLSEKW